MAGPADMTIPVTVEFGDEGLCAWAVSAAASTWGRRLASSLRNLLELLGLPGEPHVELRRGDPGRAVRLWVHGRLQPYPPGLMKRIWMSVTPPEDVGVPDTAAPDDRGAFPDAWLASYAAHSGPPDRGGRLADRDGFPVTAGRRGDPGASLLPRRAGTGCGVPRGRRGVPAGLYPRLDRGRGADGPPVPARRLVDRLRSAADPGDPRAPQGRWAAPRPPGPNSP